jgi:Xaa-Pro aminopeptidase
MQSLALAQLLFLPLKPHMTITNEPGYYEEGPLGIRIENIIEKKF